MNSIQLNYTDNSSNKGGKTELTIKNRCGLTLFVKVSTRFNLTKTFFRMIIIPIVKTIRELK